MLSYHEATEPRLQCPVCGAAIPAMSDEGWTCAGCDSSFPQFDGVPVLMTGPSHREWHAYFQDLSARQQEGMLSYAPGAPAYAEYQLKRLAWAFRRAIEKWIPAGSLVLDVGCGHGALLQELTRTYRIFGVDFAAGSLPTAQARGYRVYRADASALPFEDRQFDCVICAELFQHVSDVRSILCEAARVCRLDGAILVSTLNRQSLLRVALRAVTTLLRSEASQVPVVARDERGIEKACLGLPLRLEQTAWVLSPSPAVLFAAPHNNWLPPLSTNFILYFRKQADDR